MIEDINYVALLVTLIMMTNKSNSISSFIKIIKSFGKYEINTLKNKNVWDRFS